MSEATTVQVESLDEFSRDPKGTQARWVAEVKLAQKEFAKYHERCAKIERRYRAESEVEGHELGRGRLQLIWSTVQTQIPAVYQFPPEVEVSRRFKTKDRVARAAALGYRRGLRTLVGGMCETDFSGYPDCRPEYIAAFESMANLATKAGVEGRRIEVRGPLVDLSKADIIRLAQATKGDE